MPDHLEVTGMTSNNAPAQLSPSARLNAAGLGVATAGIMIQLNARWHRLRVRGVDP